MKTIHKYQLDAEEFTTLNVPEDATPLHVGPQHGWVTLWLQVDTANKYAERTFQLVGTGHPLPPVGTYIGTAIIDPYVWHVYEVPYEAPTS